MPAQGHSSGNHGLRHGPWPYRDVRSEIRQIPDFLCPQIPTGVLSRCVNTTIRALELIRRLLTGWHTAQLRRLRSSICGSQGWSDDFLVTEAALLRRLSIAQLHPCCCLSRHHACRDRAALVTAVTGSRWVLCGSFVPGSRLFWFKKLSGVISGFQDL